MGDKLSIGDISNSTGVAIGPGATANVTVIHEASKPRIPLLRPERSEHFVDRETSLHQLLADLQPGRVVMLCGTGGIGKSVLAAEAVWQLAPGTAPPTHFPDGIIYHDFYREPQTTLAFEKIARCFGQEPRPTPAAAAQIVLAGRHLLLVLDGAEQADDLQALLQIRDQCGVLVTSRKHEEAVLSWEDVTPLPPADAVSLLQAWGKQRATNLQAVQSICAFVGYLPLAVRLAGSYLSTRGREAEEYVKWLERTVLADWKQGKRQHDSVPVLLEQSLAQVSEEARQVMGVIGLLALAPFEQETIVAGLEGVSSIENALDELVDYSLIARRSKRYEVTHALIHTYARQRLTPPTKIVVKLASYYEQEMATHPNDFFRLNALRPHFMALLRIASEHKAWDTIIALAGSIDDYLDLQGYWTDRILAIESAIIATQATQNRQGEGSWLGALGNAYIFLGQVEKAIGYYEQALAIAQAIGDRRNEGSWLGGLGQAYYFLGQVEKAIGYYEQALAIAQTIGDRRGEGSSLGTLGNAYYSLGQAAKAISYYEQALAIAQAIGDRRGEGIDLGNLGLAYYSLRQVAKAISYYEQALAIAQAIGDRRGEGNRLGELGVAYSSLGQVEKAISYYEQALAIAQAIGDRRNEEPWLVNLGAAYRNLGQVAKAISYYEQALAIAQAIGDRRGEGKRLGALGVAYSSLGQVEKAISYYEQALAIAQAIGDHNGEGYHLGALGLAYRNLGQVEKARQLWEEALRIFVEIKSPNAETVRKSLSSLQNK